MVKFCPKILSFAVLLVIISCQSISSTLNLNNKEKQTVELGNIGYSEDLLFEDSFENIAIAKFNNPIKVSVTQADFSKSDYKKYLQNKYSKPSSIEVKYVDSIKTKPQYVILTIIDKLTIIDALNTAENTSLKELVSYQDQSELITSISAALNLAQIKQIISADEIFLVPNGIKSYALQLYTDKQPKQLIKFSDMVAFDYKSSCMCWQENTRRQLKIVDFVEGSDCPKDTYKSAKRAKKKIDYFKF